jgi:hypothetical protein
VTESEGVCAITFMDANVTTAIKATVSISVCRMQMFSRGECVTHSGAIEQSAR